MSILLVTLGSYLQEFIALIVSYMCDLCARGGRKRNEMRTYGRRCDVGVTCQLSLNQENKYNSIASILQPNSRAIFS